MLLMSSLALSGLTGFEWFAGLPGKFGQTFEPVVTEIANQGCVDGCYVQVPDFEKVISYQVE